MINLDQQTLEIMSARESQWSGSDKYINKPVLRPYQDAAISNLGASIKNGNQRVVLQAATGAGKTLTIAEVISRAESKGNRTLFVCDSLELVEQAVKAFDSYGLDVGVMQGQHYRTDESRLTQVVTAQTLERRVAKYRNEFEKYPVKLIIHDECHVQYKVRDTLAMLYPSVPVIGLTATPFAKGLGTFYSDIVSAIPMQDLIDQGFLSPFTAFAPYVPDMKGVAQTGGDWNKDASAEIYNGQLIADIVQTWKQHASNRQTLAFGCNVAHSKSIAAEFVSAGINAVHVDGYGNEDDKAARHQAIDDYKAGKIQLLSSVGITTKGFDAPATSCLIIARPTKSLSLHQQIIGRGLRIAEGKDDCIILDHAGNFVRHGFPTDQIEYKLDDGSAKTKSDSREKGESLPTPCPACNTLKVGHKCPSCGFAPEKQNEIVNVDGELVELSQVKAKAESKQKKQYTIEQKQDWYSQFLFYARDKNYKDGWAANKYRDKFGVWPNKLDKVAKPVHHEVKSYITASNIRFAKGKEKANAA